MSEKEILPSEDTPEETIEITDTPQTIIDDADNVSVKEDAEGTPSDKPSPETERLKSASEAERKKTYKTGTTVAAFIFFVITLAVFIVYEVFANNFLFKIFATKIDNFGEAIGAIFGGIFGLIMTFIFGAAQLPENIISIILFGRLRGRSDKKWENVLFTVFFALSIVMLLVMILTIVLFFAVIGSNS